MESILEKLAQYSAKGSPDASAHIDGFIAGYIAAFNRMRDIWPVDEEIYGNTIGWLKDEIVKRMLDEINDHTNRQHP